MFQIMMLRARSAASMETLLIDVLPDCTLSRLKRLIAARIGVAPETITVSLNRKDELSGSPDDTLYSLGVASCGGLVFYATDPGVFAPKTETLGAEGLGSGSVDAGMIDCGRSEAVGEALAAMEPWKVPIGESEAKQARFGAGVKFDDYAHQVVVAAHKWRFTPFFPAWSDGGGRGLSDYRLLAAAVHAVLVDSGFVRLDFETGEPLPGFQVPEFQILPDMACFLMYTLGKMLNSSVPQTVILKLYKLGRVMVACGWGGGFNDPCYAVNLDVWRGRQLGAKIGTALRKRGESETVEDGVGNLDVLLDALREGDVFELYKEVKDKLALPLLTDLCEMAGLPPPLSLMQMPTELKFKIFALVRGADLAKLACVCRELRDMTSDELLWKVKCVQEFGEAGGDDDDSSNWKRRFVESLKMEKESREGRERVYSCWQACPPYIDRVIFPYSVAGPSPVPFGGLLARPAPFQGQSQQIPYGGVRPSPRPFGQAPLHSRQGQGRRL